jgi:8-oxo-dGTP pyrophosphatase MutT (NUDIX family)
LVIGAFLISSCALAERFEEAKDAYLEERVAELMDEGAAEETSEETGIDPAQVKLLHTAIFDVDIHTIPAIGDDPRHEHIDIRFLVEIDDSLPVPGNDESHEVLWMRLFEVSRYNNNRSTYRMVEKTRYLRNVLQSGGQVPENMLYFRAK